MGTTTTAAGGVEVVLVQELSLPTWVVILDGTAIGRVRRDSHPVPWEALVRLPGFDGTLRRRVRSRPEAVEVVVRIVQLGAELNAALVN